MKYVIDPVYVKKAITDGQLKLVVKSNGDIYLCDVDSEERVRLGNAITDREVDTDTRYYFS